MLQSKLSPRSLAGQTWTVIAFATVSLVLLWLFVFRSSHLFPTDLSYFPLAATRRAQPAPLKWKPFGLPPLHSLVAELPQVTTDTQLQTPASVALLVVGEAPPLDQKGLFHLMNTHLVKALSLKGPSNVHTFLSLFETEETRSPRARETVLHRLTSDIGGSVKRASMNNATCNDPAFQLSRCCTSKCGDVASCLRFQAVLSAIDQAQDFAFQRGFSYDWFVIIRPNVGVYDILGRPLDASDSSFSDSVVYSATREERLPADYFLMVPSKLIKPFKSATTSFFSSCLEKTSDSLDIPFFSTLIRQSVRVESVDLPLTLVSPPSNRDASLVIDGADCFRTSSETKSFTKPWYSLQQVCVHAAYSLAFRYPF